TEQVEIAPARKVWQVNGEDGGLVGCWVYVPPTYATRTRTIELRPVETAYEAVPASYATRVRTVEVQPARTVYDTVPAVYATRLRPVATPPRIAYEQVPAEYRMVYRSVLVQPATAGWVPILSFDGCRGEGLSPVIYNHPPGLPDAG
ncbi:MAG: hypothetical protein JOY94_03980, partial [Methylobacteriaceae bacterium]|nr:hypothetical protein [Methylobacteriaceae bacterium]